MVLLKIAVKNNKLIKVKDYLMIEDTINGIKCSFEFRSDWSDLSTTVVFGRGHIYPATQNPQTIPASLDDNNECVVPPEIISESGEFSIGLLGENDNVRIVTDWSYYKTKPGCYDAYTPPNPPTPSEYDKILGALNNKSDIDHTHDEYMTNEEAKDLTEYILDVFQSNMKVAKIVEVTLLASAWDGDDHLYSQVVNIDGVTENSQVDLTPDVQQLATFYHKDISFVTENYGGVVTVYAIGQKPTNDYTIQATITEVEV
jgi:hypothetical protein